MKKIDTVCIVEDDPMHLFITKKYIELSGYVKDILVCRDGKEAFTKLELMLSNNEPLPKIIFLDLNMPVWDGWQFLDRFTQIKLEKEMTIFILTSSDSEEDHRRAEKYGLTGNYLVKPLKQDQLKIILGEFVY